MIRYPISEAQLRSRIDEVNPTWRERATVATDAHEVAGGFSTSSPSWSDIKDVFLSLQHNKCAYCERKLEDAVPYGRIDHDVEHFRPKNAVEPWPSPALAAERGLQYDFPTGSAMAPGYYLLAHEPRNYLTACKPCNSVLKRNFFPIEGDRVSGHREPRPYDAEQALLPFPLGNRGIRPETVVTFQGAVAVPRFHSGRRGRMGRVTVDFFDLNRDSLVKSRSLVVMALHSAYLLVTAASPGTSVGVAEATLDFYRTDAAPHASCARCYLDLLESEPVLADRHAAEAAHLVLETM